MLGRNRIKAVIEVVTLTALALVSYKTLKRLEPSGQNYSPGLVMMVVALAGVLLHRRRFASYGLTRARWRYALNVGLMCTAFYLMVGAILILVNRQQEGALAYDDIRRVNVLIKSVLGLLLAGAVLLILKYAGEGQGSIFVRIRPALGLSILAVLLATPAVWAFSIRRSSSRSLAMTVGLFVFTGFGEEIFFRGYVQSRLNEAFSRPWQIIGMRCGPGLIITCLLFGLVHVFNPVDLVSGRWELDWWALFPSVGIVYGCLRERTGTVLAGAVTHGLAGAVQVPVILSLAS